MPARCNSGCHGVLHGLNGQSALFNSQGTALTSAPVPPWLQGQAAGNITPLQGIALLFPCPSTIHGVQHASVGAMLTPKYSCC